MTIDATRINAPAIVLDMIANGYACLERSNGGLVELHVAERRYDVSDRNWLAVVRAIGTHKCLRLAGRTKRIAKGQP